MWKNFTEIYNKHKSANNWTFKESGTDSVELFFNQGGKFLS